MFNKLIIQKAVCEYKKITSDERQRMLIQAREDAWRDEEARKKADIEDAFKEGVEKGIKEGKQEGLKEGEKNSKIQIAKKMMSKNMNISEIIEFTGLSENDLKNLK